MSVLHPSPSGIWHIRARIGKLEVSFPQIILASGIALYSLAMPGDAKFKLDALGFGVCHQIHTHSYTIAGHQLPLCARCTGIYLGALSAIFLVSRLRKKAARLPTSGMLGLLGLFFGAMVLDGLNSTFQTFGAGFWDSTNLVRLVTGAASGLAVAFVFYPVFNLNLWHRDELKRERVLDNAFALAGYLAVAGILVALVLSGGDWLLYPISFLSIGGLLTLLTMANTMLVLLITRKDSMARTPHDALTFILIGLALSLLMLTLLAWGRASLAPPHGRQSPRCPHPPRPALIALPKKYSLRPTRGCRGSPLQGFWGDLYVSHTKKRGAGGGSPLPGDWGCPHRPLSS